MVNNQLLITHHKVVFTSWHRYNKDCDGTGMSLHVSQFFWLYIYWKYFMSRLIPLSSHRPLSACLSVCTFLVYDVICHKTWRNVHSLNFMLCVIFLWYLIRLACGLSGQVTYSQKWMLQYSTSIINVKKPQTPVLRQDLSLILFKAKIRS